MAAVICAVLKVISHLIQFSCEIQTDGAGRSLLEQQCNVYVQPLKVLLSSPGPKPLVPFLSEQPFKLVKPTSNKKNYDIKKP